MPLLHATTPGLLIQQLRLVGSVVRSYGRSYCTAFRSNNFETQPPADKQSVDDLIDGYDLSLSGQVPGDMPTGRHKQRILTGELRHHASSSTARRHRAFNGDYESFYHARLPRVPEYELPRSVSSSFLRHNTVVYPPRLPADPDADADADSCDDERRLPAETCVEYDKIAIDPKALLLFAIAVQGLTVQTALDKLRVLSQRPDGRNVWRKFGYLAPLCLIQAIEAGVRQMVNEESVEFESNMWVETAQVARDGSYAVLRKDARWSLVHYRRPYSVLRVRLREGRPPAYHHPRQLPAERPNWRPNAEIMRREVDKLRSQRIYRQM